MVLERRATYMASAGFRLDELTAEKGETLAAGLWGLGPLKYCAYHGAFHSKDSFSPAQLSAPTAERYCLKFYLRSSREDAPTWEMPRLEARYDLANKAGVRLVNELQAVVARDLARQADQRTEQQLRVAQAARRRKLSSAEKKKRLLKMQLRCFEKSVAGIEVLRTWRREQWLERLADATDVAAIGVCARELLVRAPGPTRAIARRATLTAGAAATG